MSALRYNGDYFIICFWLRKRGYYRISRNGRTPPLSLFSVYGKYWLYGCKPVKAFLLQWWVGDVQASYDYYRVSLWFIFDYLGHFENKSDNAMLQVSTYVGQIEAVAAATKRRTRASFISVGEVRHVVVSVDVWCWGSIHKAKISAWEIARESTWEAAWAYCEKEAFSVL